MSDKQPLGPNQTFWLKELRSGKYEQGKTGLCRNGEYCCLDVSPLKGKDLVFFCKPARCHGDAILEKANK